MISASSWELAAVVSFALVWWGPVVLRPVLAVLIPMWLPLSVMIVAAFLLFGTDQGRDLGVGLLGDGGADQGQDSGNTGQRGNRQLQLALLALALFYWATGSWHAARLGINRKFGADRTHGDWKPAYEPWLRWLPRLLGAGAHFFASLSLALAAWHVVKPDDELLGFLPLWPIVFVPPSLIVLGTFVLWRYDRRFEAARRRYIHATRHYGTSPNRRRAEAAYRKARKRLYGVIGGLVAAAVVIAGLLWLLRDRLPGGLVPATCWILASASLFLLVVSHRRAIGQFIVKHVPQSIAGWLNKIFNEKDDKGAWSSIILAALLTLMAFIVGAWAWIEPVSLGRTAGSMAIGFFAFGAYIALIDLLRILCGSGRRFAAVGAFLLLLAVGTSMTRDFHRIRLCGDALASCGDSNAADGGSGAKRWEDRPTVAEAAWAWHKQAAADWPEGEPVPMIIVATAGGGIRAAYWTATVLEALEEKLGRDLFRRHLFAISGVSGGSVGAAAYAAYRANEAENGSAAKPTELLNGDFLAPAIAATAFIDGPQSLLPELPFLPWLSQRDRGYALERAWEVASAGRLADAFLSFFPDEQELEGTAPWRPALLLNATHQDTGRRVITSHLQIERRVFLDSFDAHDLLEADMPASTAAHNSARFSYISPAGKLMPRSSTDGDRRSFGHLLDGGYFENFGAVTALQLLREVRDELGRDRVRPVIVQISSDPSLTERDRARLDKTDFPLCHESEERFLPFRGGEWQGLHWRQRDGGGWFSSFLNELTAPIAGILASRVAHGTLASQELAHVICTDRGPHDGTPWGADEPLAAVKRVPLRDAGLGVPDDSRSAPDRPPEYAHFAMCDDEDEAILPPLGWVLSPWVRDRFPTILESQCGNMAQLDRVMKAFGWTPAEEQPS